MKLIGQSNRHVAKTPTSTRFPRYIWLGLSLLTTMTFIVSGSVMAGYHELADPFAMVSDLFEGDARRLALVRGYTCQRAERNSPPSTVVDYCTQRNPNPLYAVVHLWTSGSIAKEVSLSVPVNTLTLGDLIALWGEPETHRYCETLIVTWYSHRLTAMVAVPRTSHRDYFAPIHNIYFVPRGLPDWARLLVNDALHSC
jgi:hypothetical protein